MTLWRWVVVPVLLVSVAPIAIGADPYEIAGVKLDITAASERSEFMVGEPGYVLFKVANLSDRNLRIMVGGDYRNRLGRPDSFKVEVVGAEGGRVSQPDSGMQMGGITGAEKLPAQGEYVFRLFLPDWATFEKPGRYTMTIRRKLVLVPDDGTDAFVRKTDNVEVTTKATITIIPADAAKLGKIIAYLGAKMLNRNSDEAELAEKMMAAIHDVRVIPHYVALAQIPHYSPRYAACRSLGLYNNDQAFEALKKLMKTKGADIRESATTLELAESGADGVRHAAIHALGASPHPKALPFYWTFANDRYHGVRLTILHKAAELNTPEARAIIEKMTADENETVRNEALRYQKRILDGSAAIDRGLAFLAKDALAWKAKHNCVSCHHAGLVVWAIREAKVRGHAVDEPVLAELTKWVAESGEGKTGVPRPKGIPQALNAKAVWLALGLAADPQPDAVVQKGLKLLWNTIKTDQTANGSWASWPETRPPIFGNSDDSMTALATLALMSATGDELKSTRNKGVKWLAETKTDDDSQSIAMRLVLWKRLDRPAEECQKLVKHITERQNKDGGWSQAGDMASDAWATGQALYALAHSVSVGQGSPDPAVSAAIGRGRAFLVRTQLDDGSWPMMTRPTKLGEKCSQGKIAITGAGSSWGVIGLVRSMEATKK